MNIVVLAGGNSTEREVSGELRHLGEKRVCHAMVI